MSIRNYSEMSSADYAAHVRTYATFTHMTFWVGVHLALVLVGLYFTVIQGATMGGLFFILLGIVALGYGVVKTFSRTPDTVTTPEMQQMPLQAGGEDVIVPDPVDPSNPVPPENNPANPRPLPHPTPEPEPPLITPRPRPGGDYA